MSASASLYINCGAGDVVDTVNGITWVSDSTYATGGGNVNFGFASVDTTTNTIACPVPPLAVYNDVRHFAHSYSVPVENGDYTVRIHWVDWGSYGAPAGRNMAYEIEGISVLSGFSLAAAEVAEAKTFDVTVTDGMLNINCTTAGADVFESAIEIISVPEPATMVILGLGGLLLRRKR